MLTTGDSVLIRLEIATIVRLLSDFWVAMADPSFPTATVVSGVLDLWTRQSIIEKPQATRSPRFQLLKKLIRKMNTICTE